jgi:hypothetical protein
MAFSVKQVPTLEERLCFIDEVEKPPSEKRNDVAKRLGMPPSAQNSNIVNIEKLSFSLKRKGATKEMRINGFFKKK